MKRLLALFFLLLPFGAAAQEIVLDQYECSVTLPAGESWQRGMALKYPSAEVIFNASRTETRQLFAIALIPNIPTENLEAPGVTARLLETIGTMGYKVGAPQPLQWKGAKFVQFLGRRGEAGAADSVAVARATFHNKILYLLLTAGVGDETKVKDEQFMRVMESFSFTEQRVEVPPLGSDPLFGTYRLGAYIGAALVGGLAILYLIVIASTGRRSYH